MSVTPEIPAALAGVDLTKFTAEKLVLDSDKSFDENLQANFGITADQAAEIVNYALINDIPLHPVEAKMTGGGLQNIFALIGAAWLAADRAQQTVNIVASGITHIDQASTHFVASSKLSTTAGLWRQTMSEHCPHTVEMPIRCGLLDVKCKIWDYEDVGASQAKFEYNSKLCQLANQEYSKAVTEIPAAQREALVKLGDAAQGIANLGNIVGISKPDLDKLIKDKILDKDGKVLDEAKFKAFGKQLANATDATAIAPPLPPRPGRLGGPEAPAPGGRRRAKTTKGKPKRRVTRRKVSA